MELECFLWEGVGEEQRAQIMEKEFAEEFLPKGAQLYRSGSIGFLKEGRAKILRLTKGGECVTVRGIGKGEIFGAASMFGSWTGGSSILASVPCKVCYITEERLREMIRHCPQIAFNYISYLTERIRFLNRRMDAFSAGSTEQKLYEFFLSQANEQGEVQLDFGMAELARRLKMGRSSVYRGLEELEQTGLIHRQKNKFTIV